MTDARRPAAPRLPETWRLLFRFDGLGVALAGRTRVAMVAPGSVGTPPRGGEHSGAWLEVHDREGRTIFHRILSDPFRLRAEHHSPDGRTEVHVREPEPTQFEVLVPALPDADSVVLWATVPAAGADGGTRSAPAREQGRFRLADDGEASDGR